MKLKIIATQAFIVSAMALALFGTAAGAAERTWVKAETAHFIVYSNNDVASTRVYAGKLEAFRKVASDFYGRLAQSEVVNDNRLVVYYFADHAEFSTIDPKIAETSFEPSLSCKDGEAAFWTSKELQGETTQAYQFFSENERVANDYDTRDMPAWLSSGLHSYLETADVKGDTVVLGAPTTDEFVYYVNEYMGQTQSLMTKNDRIPYAEIISGTYSNPKKTGPIRGQSWIVADYMLTAPTNLGKLYSYIDLYNSGTPSLEAWQKGTGIDPESFDAVTANYMSKGVPMVTYRFIPLTDDQITVTALPQTGESVPLLSAAVQTCPDAGRAPELIGDLEKAVAAAPEDSYARRELARAQVLIGDPAQALSYLTSEIAQHSDDYDAHYLMGRYWLSQAQSATGDARGQAYVHARVELASSYKLNPTSAPTLYYYAKAFADRPDYPSDNTLAAAEAAYDLKKDTDYEVYLAELYARRGMIDDMKATLPNTWPQGKSNYAVVTNQIYTAIDAGKPAADIASLFSGYRAHSYLPQNPSKK